MMTGMDDDLALIAACRSGQTQAFGTLVRRYQDRLYPTAFRLTGGAEDALDLVQDTFLRAFEKLGSFRGDSSFYTWIYQVMLRLALTERRKKKLIRLRQKEDEDPREPTDDSVDRDPSFRLERQERSQAIQDALDALMPDHRAVVVMKEFDGLRYEEIAAILEIPVGTVRSRLHRARLDLRERLKSIVDEPATSRSVP
jgi:RNA polymerase sigma-70 factor (ECF subfamily)